MRARRGHGHGGGLALDLIGHFLAPSIMGPMGEVEADRHKCNLCGKCQFACRRHAIYVNHKSRIWTLYPNRCNFWLNCVSVCPKNALKIVK